MDAADLIHADGQPLVLFSRWVLRRGLPERAATTDFYHTACRAAAERGLRFFLLGADGATIDKTAAETRRLYPDLNLVGWRSGYFGAEEERGDRRRHRRAPGNDVLWIGMGKPREQMFARAQFGEAACAAGWLAEDLRRGCSIFVSGNNSRAPQARQAAGLEWTYPPGTGNRGGCSGAMPGPIPLRSRSCCATPWPSERCPRGPAAADGG